MEIYKNVDLQKLLLIYRLLCLNLSQDKHIGPDVAFYLYKKYLLSDLMELKKKRLKEEYVDPYIRIIDYRYDYANVIEMYRMHRSIFEARIFEVVVDNYFEDGISDALDFVNVLSDVDVELIDGEDDREYGFHIQGPNRGIIRTALHNDLFSPENLRDNNSKLNVSKYMVDTFKKNCMITILNLCKYNLSIPIKNSLM